jgi:uncharacterized membrane protein YedE/YeeE
MELAFFAPWQEIFAGIFTGIVFGFLLRKAKVTRFDVIVGQLLLKDFTVLKVMLTAIFVGSIGVYGWIAFSGATILPSATTLFAALIGGGIFGIGMATFGFCPGTSVGALADGQPNILWGIAGMILGAGIYAEMSGFVERTLKPLSAYTVISLPELLGVSPWLIIAVLGGMVGCMYMLLKKIEINGGR